MRPLVHSTDFRTRRPSAMEDGRRLRSCGKIKTNVESQEQEHAYLTCWHAGKSSGLIKAVRPVLVISSGLKSLARVRTSNAEL